MPELPEVETVRRQLAKEVVGRTVKSVEVNFAGRLNVSARSFSSLLRGHKLESVRRRAKLLILEFSGGVVLLAHLKMTGAFRLVTKGGKAGKHDHVAFRLDGEHDMFFSDPRKFGYLRIYKSGEALKEIERMNYGPEPLEAGFTPAVLQSCLLRHPKMKVKQALLDQKCVAGIGNIYADETLWQAKVAPTRTVADLKQKDIGLLRDAIVDVLKKSVRRRGTSSDDFRDVFGRKGGNGPHLQAYGRAGEKCFRCDGEISKIRLAGRGTNFCPKCQK